MGVTHKLKPEVTEFILKQKKDSPALSCRKLADLVLAGFKIEISKSSINAIIKQAGLSGPIGRTPKKKRKRIAMPNLPVLLEDNSAGHCQDEKEVASAPPALSNDSNIEAPGKDDGAAKEAEKEQALRQEELERQAQEKEKALEEERRKEELKKAQEEAEEKARVEAENLRLAKAEEERNLREEAAKQAQEEDARRRAEEVKTRNSLSVGRLPQLENSGILLLRGADSIIGVSRLIASMLKNRLPGFGEGLEGMLENILYLPLLEGKIEESPANNISGVFEEIENIKVANLDIARIINAGLKDIRCLKVILSDGTILYLDGQFYSAWSSPHIPYDFASPIHNLKERVDQYFNQGKPFILFNAPGYDAPSPEFFNFLAGLEGRSNKVTNLILYGNKLDEQEVLTIADPAKKRSFIFGVWPWQFTECRKVKSIGEFRSFELPEQERVLYIADIEIELRNPSLNKQITLYGGVLKLSLQEKTRLVILSNFVPQEKSPEELAALYLGHWPNMEEAFQDYSRKIELFTYTANSQRFFNPENLGLTQVVKVKDLFKSYLAALDAYSRWHLLPVGYEDKEMGLTKERFYDLGVRSEQKDKTLLAGFDLPAEYRFGKDLSYALRRINEKEAVLADGLKLYFKP